VHDALRAGRHDDALVYRKAVRKDLDAYTKTIEENNDGVKLDISF
jgi:hypothetical protein